MSKAQCIYHIIISTRRREPTLDENRREDLFRFIWKFFQSHNCKLLRINGVTDHIHILVDISVNISLADLMRDLKSQSSIWIKTTCIFPSFNGWSKEYAAFSCSQSSIDPIIEYIKSQPEHHKQIDFQQELQKIFAEVGMTLHKNDLND